MAHALPLLYAVLLWFVGTGAVLWLDRRPQATHRLSLGLATLAAGIALWAMSATAASTTATAAFVGFTCAVLVWGMHELSFLTGILTGPRTAPLPPGVTGWPRFRMAAATLIHHEIALALTLVLMILLTRGEPNQTGPQAFGLLFAMRLSTKLNLFIGLKHVDTTMLPDAQRYLVSYFGHARVNPLFPQSIVAGLAIAYVTASAAIGAATDGGRAGYTLIFGLTLLGLIEHAFLALPLRDARLWRWAMPSPRLVTAHTPLGAQQHTHRRVD